MSASLAWKINRVRQMSLPEVLWRAGQVAQKKAAKWGLGLASRPPEPDMAEFGPTIIHAASTPAMEESIVREAERLLAGHWDVFALKNTHLGFPPEWNRDPKSGTVAPGAMGKSLDYRNERLVGNIKYLWEPGRHLQLVTLAQAWNVTGRARYAEGVRTLLTSWLDACPYPCGVHWTSSLELAVRLVNWAFTWHCLGGAESPLFAGTDGENLKRRWLSAIYQHCHFIRGYLSRHSSANNHLFGEYMGLFVAAVTWPCWRESAAWREFARAGLETEAIRQNTPDGVNKEQAVYYQHEVMDMMLLCHLVGHSAGIAFSPAFLQRLESLAEFVAAVMDTGGNVPMIGDADDAQMVRLSHETGWDPYRSLLASCAVLFSRADFKRKAGAFDDKNRWLFGPEGEAAFDGLTADASSTDLRRAYPDGGYWVLGSDLDTSREIRLVADAGPLGYLSIAAHGHADALAMTLSAAGQELLIDPGTYAYHTDKSWRNYFRGTAAHNTVRIDQTDQSVIGGNFMWLQRASARCLTWQSSAAVDHFTGQHDGYRRLADPVQHQREIILDKSKGMATVRDTLTCNGRHEVELHWHCHEAAQVELEGSAVSVRRDKAAVTISFSDAGFALRLARGEELPPLGWVSRRFDEKQPTTTVVWHGWIDGSCTLVTTLAIETIPSPAQD